MTNFFSPFYQKSYKLYGYFSSDSIYTKQLKFTLCLIICTFKKKRRHFLYEIGNSNTLETSAVHYFQSEMVVLETILLVQNENRTFTFGSIQRSFQQLHHELYP